jgi:hypothetical protein
MKTLLIMLVVSLCAIAWRSEDIVNALSKGGIMPGSTGQLHVQELQANPGTPGAAGVKPMSVDELAQLSHTDPGAYQKFLQSRTVNERTQADKLMNFFAHGKYE